MSSFPYHIKEHTVPGQHVREWARATANSQEDVLNIHVKQYIPKDNPSPQPGDVTILGAHANGFPKELYEALWEDLHTRSKAHGFRIRGIWIADVSNQGWSAQINEDKLGNDPCWHDHSRDLLHLTNVFRAEMPRPIVGVGHSFGANILTHLSLLHPRLLTTLVLLDPTIIIFDPARNSGPGSSPARASTFRRETWPSRQVAIESFQRSPFYRSWDPRVLKAWTENSIRKLPTLLFPELPSDSDSSPKANPASPSGSGSTDPGVTLRTPKHQEVFTFFRPLWPYITAEPPASSPPHTIAKSGVPDYDVNESSPLNPGPTPYAFYRSEGGLVLKALPAVRPSALFVHGSTSEISPPHIRDLRVSTCGIGPGGSGGVAAGRVAEVVMEGKGHLFPMEYPDESAAHAARWIGTELARWREEEAEYESWTKLPVREKTTMSEEFMDRVGRPKPRPKKSKL
ncbi:Alpha/beta hydrolase family-domain-containing protein [Xylaria arbuscula]|nr:Alpha/beta hydrolase family-domain-containing protein [Xylaria arbuscula]